MEKNHEGEHHHCIECCDSTSSDDRAGCSQTFNHGRGGTGWQRIGQTCNQGMASRFIVPGWLAMWLLAVMPLVMYIGWSLNFHADPPWLRWANQVLYGPPPLFSSGLAQAAHRRGGRRGIPRCRGCAAERGRASAAAAPPAAANVMGGGRGVV